MSLRKKLIGLAGTLMLAVSPTAIVLAQDAQSPTVETPAPGKPSPEEAIRRHKQQQEGAPDQSQGQAQGQDETPMKPRQGKKPAAQDDAGEAPTATDGGAPAMKPKRQKPEAAQPDSGGAAPNANDGAGAPAVKPKPQKPEAPQPDSGGAAPNANDGAGAPAVKPKPQKPEAGAESPAPTAPAPAPAPAAQPPAQNNAQPDNGQPQGGKPPRQNGQRPADQNRQGGAAPGSEPQAQPDQGQGKRRDRTNQQGQPGSGEPAAAPGNGTQPQRGQEDGSQQGQGGRNHLPGQRTSPDQGYGQDQQDGMPGQGRRNRLPGQGNPPGQDGYPDQGYGQDQQGGMPGQGRRNRLPGQGNPPGQDGYPDQGYGQDQQGGMPGQGGRYRPRGQGGFDDQQGQDSFVRGPVNQGAEQRAIGLLSDRTPPDRLNDQQLRQRLNVYRGVLAAGNLSPGTEQALIQRLNEARVSLRNRVSGQEYGGPRNGQPSGNSPFGRPQFREGRPTEQDIPAILADRRPSGVLTIDQLNRRILVYRDASNDQRYSPDDREAFAQYLQDDRSELGRRLINDRGQRQDRLRRPAPGYRLDMDVAPRGQRQQSIWAAEVNDDQIEQQFASRPLRPLPRRYNRADFFAQPEMVMEQPAIRQAIPGVELDTIHFGFNESFIREEETANLDRVGRILERIVAAHPNEVFVIEGNTDAVGDDGYNLRLSKQRAEAVKQALTQYYVISPDNLVTAGLGERYLKIPTPEPEQENRRVTIRRVTPLLQN